jgi:peptidyl-prolyl cis-trans isomerase-like 3
MGRMLEGWDVLEKMKKLPIGPKKNRPLNPPVIERITIHANPLADEGIVYPDKNGGPEKV